MNLNNYKKFTRNSEGFPYSISANQVEITSQNNDVDNVENDNNKENENDIEEDEYEDNVEINYEWIGKCIKQQKGKTYYGQVRVDGVTYKIGQACYVEPDIDDCQKRQLWLAKLEELYEFEGDGYMGNGWYWKWKEIKKAVKDRPYSSWEPDDKDEVFESCGHKPDENHISLIAGTYKLFNNKKQMNQYRKNNKKDKSPNFFSEYKYNVKQKKLLLRGNNKLIDTIQEGDEEEEEEQELQDEDKENIYNHNQQQPDSENETNQKQKPIRKYSKKGKNRKRRKTQK